MSWLGEHGQRHRPMYDGLNTDEEKLSAMMKSLTVLQTVQDENGLEFSHKTALWVAYERYLESQRDDSLFIDPLAQYLHEPYGQPLSDTFAFGLKNAVFDPPPGTNGLGMEGHVMYTAARTHFINIQLTEWLESNNNEQDTQVVNLGAGADTRVFWLESLQKASMYWEIDTPQLTRWRESILESLSNQNKLPSPLCSRQVVAMDFSRESIADLPIKHHYDNNIPTCWILEGLIMYLERNDTVQLMEHISALSAKGSKLILNFATNNAKGPTIDEITLQLQACQWTKTSQVMFGDPHFSFGRYPPNQTANACLGFAIYVKD